MLNNDEQAEMQAMLYKYFNIAQQLTELHAKDEYGECKECGGPECWDCGEWGCDLTPCECECHVYWPCKTIKILEGLNETA